jgi:hypothetical protein
MIFWSAADAVRCAVAIVKPKAAINESARAVVPIVRDLIVFFSICFPFAPLFF